MPALQICHKNYILNFQLSYKKIQCEIYTESSVDFYATKSSVKCMKNVQSLNFNTAWYKFVFFYPNIRNFTIW